MINLHTKFEISSLSRSRDISESATYDCFVLLHLQKATFS